MIEAKVIHKHLEANKDKLDWSKSHIIPYGLLFTVQAKGNEYTVKVRKNLEDNRTYNIRIITNVWREAKDIKIVELDKLIETIKSNLN